MPKPKRTRIDGPWFPVDYEPADASAIQGCILGTATPDQQMRAMRWIIEKAAGTYEECYYPDRPNDTAYACGSRFVGQQIVKLSKLKVSRLTGVETENG